MQPALSAIVSTIENPDFLAQKETDNIKQALNTLLDNMKKNKSVISRMADAWGKFSILSKIGGGLILFGPLLLIGIVAVSTLLIVFTCICALMYTLLSMGLDNHHTTNKDEHDKLTSEINSLGSLLNTIILKLSKISSQLSSEVETLGKTNTDLKKEIDQSAKNNATLAKMITVFSSSIAENRESNSKLDQCIGEFRKDKEAFFAALDTLGSVSNELNTCLQRHKVLLEQYESCIKQHTSKPVSDIRVRTKETLGHTPRYFNNKQNMNKSMYLPRFRRALKTSC